MAIYAVAMQVILLGLVPTAGNGETVNPISVICHTAAPSGAASTSNQEPVKPAGNAAIAASKPT